MYRFNAPNYNPDATKDDGSCEEVANEFLLTGTLSANKTLDASHMEFPERELLFLGVTLTIPAEQQSRRLLNRANATIDHCSRWYN